MRLCPAAATRFFNSCKSRKKPPKNNRTVIIIQPWGTGARRQRASQSKNHLKQSPAKRNKGSFISNFELEQAGRRPPATWTITTSTAATATATTTTRGGGGSHPRTHTTSRGMFEFGKKNGGNMIFEMSLCRGKGRKGGRSPARSPSPDVTIRYF